MKNADGEMADDDFKEVKKLTKGKIEVLERRLNDLATVGTEIKDLVASALKKVANIDRRYENGDIKKKGLYWVRCSLIFWSLTEQNIEPRD